MSGSIHDGERWILEACAAEPEGRPIRDLVRAHTQAGRSVAVARASVSRSLRRLWRRGLVELCESYVWAGHVHPPHEYAKARNLTSRAEADRRRLAEAEADPQAYYDGLSAFLGGRARNPHADPAALLAFHQRKVARGPRGGYMRWVSLTDAGREAVNSCGAGEVNPPDLAGPVNSDAGETVNQSEIQP